MILTSETRSSYSLVDFDYGLLSLRVTDAHGELLVNGKRYLPEPAMEIKLSSAEGGLTDKPSSIILPTNGQQAQINDFAQAVSDGRAWAKTRVRIAEILVGHESTFDPSPKINYLFDGVLAEAARNAKNTPNAVEITADWHKVILDASLGMPSSDYCWATYGRPGCFIQIQEYVSYFNPQARFWHRVKMGFGSISAVVEITEMSGPTPGEGINSSTDKWSRGYVLDPVTGLRILIREYRPTTYSFTLVQQPPENWNYSVESKELYLFPGCLKTVAACTVRGNLANFNGLGLGTPAYNPAIDEGTA